MPICLRIPRSTSGPASYTPTKHPLKQANEVIFGLRVGQMRNSVTLASNVIIAVAVLPLWYGVESDGFKRHH